MARKPGSGASSDAAWLRLYAAVAALPLVLTACGGGGGGGGSPTPPQSPPPAPAPTPVASVTVTASTMTTAAPGGGAITLNAAVTGSSETPTWTLSGPGTLSATSGTVVTYTPPATQDFDATAPVIVSAKLTNGVTGSVTLGLTTNVAGLSWSNVSVTSIGTLQSVDYANGHYVAVSNSGASLSSLDASSWASGTALASGSATDHFDAQALTHLGNTFIAAGSASPAPYTSSTGAIAYSTDGLTWTQASTLAVTTPVHGLIASTRLYALGDSVHIYSSPDGHTWTAVAAISGVPALRAGTWSGSRYVAVGDGGYIAVSNDGTVWQASPVAQVNNAPVALRGVAWTGTQFVTVGDSGLIATSPDGYTWTSRTSALTGSLRSVAVSTAGELVVVGDAGIETSTDGITWHTRDAAGAAALYDVSWVNSQFMAVGAASAIKTSTH